MGYYPILDRAPKGRDEEGSFQVWLRRHDEYARDDEAVVPWARDAVVAGRPKPEEMWIYG